MSRQSEDAAGSAGDAQVAWKSIGFFRVICKGKEFAQAKIYANGYQQLPVQVNIRALDASGAIVKLSQSQLDGIKLIEYVGDVPLYPNKTLDPTFEYNWPVGLEGDQGESEDSDATSDVDASEVQTVMRYLRVSRTTNIRIAATITSPDGVAYQTNRQFDSWIDAIVVPPVQYGPGSVILEREDEIGGMFVDIDLYYIGFDHPNRVARMETMYSEENEPHYHQGASGTYFSRTHIGYSLGNKRSVKYPASGDDERAPWFTVNKYPGKVTVARISNSFRPNSPVSKNLYMHVWDQNGNQALITVRPSSDGNTMSIEVSKAGAEPEDDEAAGAT